MKDFYSFYAYFNSIDGPPLDGNKKDHAPVLKVYSEDRKRQLAVLDRSEADANAKLKRFLAAISHSEPEKPKPRNLSEPMEFVLIDDAVPEGGKAHGKSPWSFVNAPAPVFSGAASHTRTANGLSQHFIEGAPAPLKISDGDEFFCYVNLSAKNPPKQIMLQ